MTYKTEIICSGDEDGMLRAAELIKMGELVAFPTETVYGLGANALDPQAVKKIYVAKGRPSDNPLITHIWSTDQLNVLCREVPEKARLLMRTFWPGPLTIIMKKAPGVPRETTGRLDTVGVRMPDHPLALELLKKCGLPIAAPSANISGKPSPTTALGVFDDMTGRIPMIIDGGDCRVGVESTVLDMTRDIPMILRPGGVTKEELIEVLGRVEVHQSALEPLDTETVAASPGMKYKHYAPKAHVHVVSGNMAAKRIAKLYDEEKSIGGKPVILAFEEDARYFGERDFHPWGSANDPSTVARNLFSALRETDEIECSLVLCHAVETAGVGLAVMNRLLRAAGFDIEEYNGPESDR